MAKWRKRFEAWAAARQPVSVDEVESILFKVFGERVAVNEGGSHRWTVSVPELAGTDDTYPFGNFTIPVKNGKQVKAPYLQVAHEAARRLGLPEEAKEDDDEKDDESRMGRSSVPGGDPEPSP